MEVPSIADRRLCHQRLSCNPLATPAEVVAWLGAVQAQDYPGAKWALAMRMQQTTDGAIEEAFNNGEFLRTHVMRPTWHFVTPTDIRWLLALTAPRVNVVCGTMYRRLELDDGLLGRSNEVIAGALDGGKHLTRAELGSALAEAGIATDNMRLGFIVMRAELDAVICSGPRRGKQWTYALLDERAPRSAVLPRDEALAELARRYFTGHGPATVYDFAWWSGLIIADAKAGIELAAAHLQREEIDGKTYWFDTSMPPAAEHSTRALLLPTYDEFLVGFASFDLARHGGRNAEELVFDSTIVLDGKVAGSWRRTINKKEVVVELEPFDPLTKAESEAVTTAVERYGQFMGLPARCVISSRRENP